MVGFSDEGYAVFVYELTSVAAKLPDGCVCRQLYEQLLLDADSDEYRSAENRLTTAKLAAQFKLAKVLRIRAPYLEAKYNIHKAQLQNQYFGHEAILSSLEREVFHGTPQMSTTKILARGFDPKFGSQVWARTFFGQGCYFARDLSYSVDDRYSVPNAEGYKFVFVVHLLVGAKFKVPTVHAYLRILYILVYYTVDCRIYSVCTRIHGRR